MRRRFAIAACMAAYTAVVGACRMTPRPASNAAPPATPTERRAVLGGAVAEGNLLAELESLRGRAASGRAASGRAPGGDANARPDAALLDLLRLEAEAGNYAAAHRAADRVYGPPGARRDTARLPNDVSAADALSAVAAAAGGARVMMVNEAHHVPQHRAFTLQLLAALRAKGYRHFAAETLYDADPRLAERGYATPESGAYINEPLYADLVRTAIRLGYRVVAYEARSAGDPARRERGQATNLIDRVLRDDPGAKLLVHAGYAHVSKSGTLAGAMPMAAQFRALTGIEPLTIDQTAMTEHSAPEHEHPLYRHALERLGRLGPGLADRPAVLVAARGALWTHRPTAFDVSVVHPRTRYESGRPTWLRLSGARAAYALPRDVCGRAARCLVEARPVAEGADAVPLDRVEVGGGAAPALMLPPGEYRVRARDADGVVTAEFSARVGPPSPRR